MELAVVFVLAAMWVIWRYRVAKRQERADYEWRRKLERDAWW